MKNRNSLLVSLMLIGGLFMQPLTIQSFDPRWYIGQEESNVMRRADSDVALLRFLTAAPLLPYTAFLAYMGDFDKVTTAAAVVGFPFYAWILQKIENAVIKDCKEYLDFRKVITEEELKTAKDEVLAGIDKQISNLINEKTPADEGHQSDYVFLTTKSKIFVLKNIQDFFDFEDSKIIDTRYSQKEFNDLVYQSCIKKINELERQLLARDEKGEVKRNEDGSNIFLDSNQLNRIIDIAREKYMQDFNISTTSLKIMTPQDLKNKMEEAAKLLEQLKNEIASIENTVENKLVIAKKLTLVSALTPIIYHLTFKSRQRKQAINMGDNANRVWYSDLKHKAAYVAALRTLQQRPDQNYTEQEISAQQQKIVFEPQQKLKSQTEQSIFSRVKSYFASWFK